MEKIYIFGHRFPDTDSVTSAIALEYLKKSLGIYAEARVLGEINDETKYVLERFNIKVPKYLNDVKLQIKDIEYHKNLFVEETASIEDVYKYMYDNNITGVPIVDNANKFADIVTAKTILREVFNPNSNNIYTSYENILKTVEGEALLRYDEEIKGKVTAVTYKSTTFIENFKFEKEDILIVGDRHSIIEAAAIKGVKLIILTENSSIKSEHIEIAKEHKVNIIRTPFDTFKTVKKISLSNYIKNLHTKERPYTILESDYYDDFLETTNELGYNNYPVVDKKNVCKGLIRITDINKKRKKKVILVDHNELEQSAIGLEEAAIEEVIDHHKIGDISTSNPINFRNMAVGSTNTIVYYLYKENRVEIPKEIASLMLAGIISDTLALTSPTTTIKDKEVVKKLEEISGLDYQEYSKKIFGATADFSKKTESDIINTDIKTFHHNGRTFKVSQVISMSVEPILERKEKLIKELDEIKRISNCEHTLLLITDILENSSYLLFDSDLITQSFIERSLNQNAYQGMYLKGVVSRKKQVIPLLMDFE